MDQLSKEEQEILDAFESGEIVLSPNQEKLLKEHMESAKAMLQKNKRMNIRMTSRDHNALQARALKEGIPCQTLIMSILHKYLDGQLTETR